jgi:hypothetical protein
MVPVLTTSSLAKSIQASNPTLYAALTCHRTHRGKKLSFDRSPSMKALYADTRTRGAVIKSTQGGVSEWFLCKGINTAANGKNIFWVLPTYSLVGRFVRERFDRTMRAVPRYGALASEVDAGRFADSATMKQFGKGTIALVGSNTASAFTEFPADVLFIDELDRCDQRNIAMAWERLSASESPEEWYVSNPTITGFGIDEKYSESTMGRWHIKCPHCGSYQHPEFIGSVIREAGDDQGNYYVIDPDYEFDRGIDPQVYCQKCNKPYDPRMEGTWIETYPSRPRAGYHYNKLFTANVGVGEILERFVKSEGDETLRQRVWNADFGLAYDAPGARVLRGDILAAQGDYALRQPNVSGAVVAGIDVGSRFHIVIGIVRHEQPLRIIDICSVRTEDEVMDKLREWKPRSFVIDALPETRISRVITTSVPGGYVCYFGGGKSETVSKGAVTVDRTSLLDAVRSSIVTKSIEYPQGVANVPDFIDHMTASTRIFDAEANRGEGAYSWVEGSKQDHYFLAQGYMTLAARILVSAAR